MLNPEESEYDASYRELVQWRAGDVADKSLESTRRMKVMVDRSKDAGAQTLNNLESQKAKLLEIDGTMDVVRADVREAESNLTNAECCGLCSWPWRRKTASSTQVTTTLKDNKVKPDSKHSKKSKVTEAVSAQNEMDYNIRITNDSREDEMVENLEYVHGAMSDLKSFGLEIRSEVLSQNQLVDRIASKGEDNISHVKSANRRTENIFK